MAQMLKQSPFYSSIGPDTHCLTYSAGFYLKVTFVRGLVIRQKRTAPIKTASKIATLFADKVTNSPSIGGSARRAREALSSPSSGGSTRRAREALFSPSSWRECPQGEGGFTLYANSLVIIYIKLLNSFFCFAKSINFANFAPSLINGKEP